MSVATVDLMVYIPMSAVGSRVIPDGGRPRQPRGTGQVCSVGVRSDGLHVDSLELSLWTISVTVDILLFGDVLGLYARVFSPIRMQSVHM